MYVYQSFEHGLQTVGFYDPSGKWHAESDWSSEAEAAERVHWLNGAPQAPELAELTLPEPGLYGLRDGNLWMPRLDREPVWYTEYKGLALAAAKNWGVPAKIIGPHGEPLDLPEVRD